jgi:hypothetical protein
VRILYHTHVLYTHVLYTRQWLKFSCAVVGRLVHTHRNPTKVITRLVGSNLDELQCSDMECRVSLDGRIGYSLQLCTAVLFPSYNILRPTHEYIGRTLKKMSISDKESILCWWLACSGSNLHQCCLFTKLDTDGRSLLRYSLSSKLGYILVLVKIKFYKLLANV